MINIRYRTSWLINILCSPVWPGTGSERFGSRCRSSKEGFHRGHGCSIPRLYDIKRPSCRCHGSDLGRSTCSSCYLGASKCLQTCRRCAANRRVSHPPNLYRVCQVMATCILKASVGFIRDLVSPIQVLSTDNKTAHSVALEYRQVTFTCRPRLLQSSSKVCASLAILSVH